MSSHNSHKNDNRSQCSRSMSKLQNLAYISSLLYEGRYACYNRTKLSISAIVPEDVTDSGWFDRILSRPTHKTWPKSGNNVRYWNANAKM